MTRFNPYSRHYEALKRIGHNRPSSAFGAPTLVWHLAMWPFRLSDPTHVQIEPEIDALVDSVRPHSTKRSRKHSDSAAEKTQHQAAVDCYFDRSLERQKRINEFLLGLQNIGRHGSTRSQFQRIDSR